MELSLSNMEDTICLMITPAMLWMLGSHDEYIPKHSSRVCAQGGEGEETKGRRERCREGEINGLERGRTKEKRKIKRGREGGRVCKYEHKVGEGNTADVMYEGRGVVYMSNHALEGDMLWEGFQQWWSIPWRGVFPGPHQWW